MNPRVFIVALVLLALGGSALFLAEKSVPAPRHTTEKVLSNAQFFK